MSGDPRSSFCVVDRACAGARDLGILARMPLVYVTGISGAGKSTVCAELRRLGHDAHDTDQEGNAVWVNRLTGEVTLIASARERGQSGWLDEQEWRLAPTMVEILARRARDRVVFLCGSAANEHEVWHLFSRVVYLAVDEATLVDRLASRTSNDFGKSETELAAILGWHAYGDAEFARLGATIIDATRVLDEVVDDVLRAAV